MKPFNNRSIKTYLIGISVIFTLVITILVASFSYYSFNSLLSRSLIQSTSFNLHLASETISTSMLPIISMSKWSETTSQLSKYIELSSKMGIAKNSYLSDKTDFNKAAYTIAKAPVRIQSLISWKRLLEEYRNNRSSLYINRIVISDHYNNYLQISPVSTYHALDICETITGFSSFESQITSNDILWTELITSPFSDNSSDLVLPIIRPVYASFSNVVIGWSYMAISSTLITDAFESYDLPSDSHLFITINKHTYQLQNHILSEVFFEEGMNPTVNENHNKTNKIIDVGGKEYNVVSIESSLDGWIFSQTLSPSQFNEQRQVYYALLVFISFIVILLGFGLTFFLNRTINKPLLSLIRKMDLISAGDFSKDPNIEWSNELGSIGKGINNLAENVVVLMDKRIEDEKEKNDLEYQILQSQINPHFLYNTLNSIKWMATIQNANGIAEMTTSLSKLLRSVSKSTKQIHSLEEEIALLDNYFIIQKYRYGGALNLNYVITDSSLLSSMVPKFSLQPIVENAIFHGIEPKGSSGTITINVFTQNEDDLIIEIHDNGVGMTLEQIEDVLSPKADNKSDFFKKIGINNVNTRLKHAFGNNYGISIISSINEGTTMTLRLIKRSTHD